jgi:hypothetical protein
MTPPPVARPVAVFVSSVPIIGQPSTVTWKRPAALNGPELLKGDVIVTVPAATVNRKPNVSAPNFISMMVIVPE